MNTANKGTRVEKLALDSIDPKKWPLRWKTTRHKWLNIDLFGLFDICVGNEHGLRFIQVKTGYAPKEVFENIGKLRLPKNCYKEIWCWFGKKKGWKKYSL